jgi:predicted kinase
MEIENLQDLEEKISKQSTPFIVIGVGIPGSGKTTVLKKLADHLDVMYISSDNIREEVTGSQHDQSANAEVWAKVYRRVASTVQNGESVIVDATHIYRRRTTVKQYRSYGAVSVVAITFAVPFSVAKQRNAARERTVDEQVLHKMQTALENTPVTKSEGFDLVAHYKPDKDIIK